MVYGFALLAVLLALVEGIPALMALARMRSIRARGVSTHGMVISSPSAVGWLWVAMVGNQDRPRVSYRSAKGDEMTIQVATSSVFPQRRYQIGQPVEVIYDKTMAGEAYVQNEWGVMLRDVWLAVGALVVAALLVWVGLALGLP